MELTHLSGVELASRIAAGECTSDEVCRAFAAKSDVHHAFLIRDEALIMEAAGRAKPGPLCGVPVAVKDNISVAGQSLTCASKILEGHVAAYDAHCIEQLRRQGGVVFGRTNMDEFAMGSSGEHSAFGDTKNPWDLSCVPGGSSSGSAAAVAGGLIPWALGSDTGGSVRQPAAMCGLTAIKPTYGRVSRYGLVAFASSLDQVGTIARSVTDAATLLDAISGHDTRDSTSATYASTQCAAACEAPLGEVCVGVWREGLCHPALNPGIREKVEVAIEILQKEGARIVDIELPHAKHAVSVYYIIATAEASSNLSRFDGMRYGRRVGGKDLTDTYEGTRSLFGAEVKRRILLGTFVLSAGYYDAYFGRAQKVRRLIANDFTAAFEKCDVILSPTTPTTAFKFGAQAEPMSMYLQDLYTLPASLAGLPAMSTPVGTQKGLPVGVHLTSRAFEDEVMVKVARTLERSSNPLAFPFMEQA